MFGWLRRVFASSEPEGPERISEILLPMIDEALGSGRWGPQQRVALCRALDGFGGGGSGSAAFEEHLPALRERFERWYAEHPFEVKWGRDYEFRVVDPMDLTTEQTVPSSESAALAPWATLLRSFVLETDGANVFHHGCDLRDLLDLLHALHPTTRIKNFPLPFFQDYRDAHVDEFVELLCHDDKFEHLEHLALGSKLPLTGRHIERLTEARWARSLMTLDLTETTVDWSVDRAEELHRMLPQLSAFESLTHLFMYNNLHTAADVAAFVEASLPAVTHINLGSLGDEPEIVDHLAAADSFPSLTELCLSGVRCDASSGWDRLAEAPFAVYLHGRRVTAEYPRRTTGSS